jgi:16S rRNA (cytosine1402-N4)-methyltransferase
MDATSGKTAADLVKELSRSELRRLLRAYGEEPQATRIAAAIDRAREHNPIQTTRQLAQVITSSVPAAGVKALARTFQALRIAVNNELEELDRGLVGAWESLASGGHLVALSYHSLEDRKVKAFFANKTRDCSCPPNLPVCMCGGQAQATRLIRRAIRPTLAEIRSNPRARSAVLRALKKF